MFLRIPLKQTWAHQEGRVVNRVNQCFGIVDFQTARLYGLAKPSHEPRAR